MASPEVLRVRAVVGVNVSDWRVPARHGQRAQYIGRDINGEELVTEFRRTDGHLVLIELRRALKAGELLAADPTTAAWSGVAFAQPA